MPLFHHSNQSALILALGCGCWMAAVEEVAAQAPRARPADPALAANPANDFFQRGKNLHDAAAAATNYQERINLYQRSAQIFSEYLAAFPNHANAEMAWWYLGISEYKSGNLANAKRCFSTLINRYGEGRWAAAAAYTLGADHYNKGQYAMASPLFERYAKHAAKPEERVRGKYFAGNCYRLLEQERQAIAAYREVLADPSGRVYHADAKLSLGYLSLSAGKLNDAVDFFEQAYNESTLQKSKAEAALQVALASIKLGNNTKADQYLRIILAAQGMADFHSEAQSALMGNLFAKEDYREITRLFQSSRGTRFTEKDAPRLMVVARAYMRLKQPAEAVRLFREVERIVDPKSDYAFQASYYRLLCFYEIEGRHVPDQVDAFLELYQRGRPNDPHVHIALLMKAESLFAAGKINDAAQAYTEINEAVISKKNQPGLLYQRGWCLAEAGDPKGAIRSLSRFIKEYLDDSRIITAHAKRATCHGELGDANQAIADYDRLTKEPTTDELRSFAWLESARLRRKEGNINDMTARYQGLMKNVETLSPKLQAEANYWIGWGMVKSNTAQRAVPYLEKARSLRPEAYGKHAGILLALGYYAAQNAEQLAAEIGLAIKSKYDADIPDQAVQWCGIQTYNSGDYEMASTCLGLISTPDDPRSTAKEVWRYLGKSLLEVEEYGKALDAINHALEVEKEPAWKADGLLDRATALFALKKYDESRQAADEALGLRPQGRTSGKLRILIADVEAQAGNYKKAAADYQVVVQFMDDKLLKPIALHKLANALEKQGDETEAAKYRAQLKREFPSWKPE